MSDLGGMDPVVQIVDVKGNVLSTHRLKSFRMIDEPTAGAEIVYERAPRACRVCGCTDDDACIVDAPREMANSRGRVVIDPAEPSIRAVRDAMEFTFEDLFGTVTCFWVEPDLCSECA